MDFSVQTLYTEWQEPAFTVLTSDPWINSERLCAIHFNVDPTSLQQSNFIIICNKTHWTDLQPNLIIIFNKTHWSDFQPNLIIICDKTHWAD